MPAMGRITVSEMLWIIVKTPGEKFAGVVPTSVAMEPTCSFTVSNSPDRLFMIADTSITITENTEEDDITQEWYGKISLRWTSENRATILRINSIGPVHQYQDPTLKKKRGYKPTIDFCFRDWDTSNSYFGAECKNLYNHKKDKIKRYVETGVKNYISGRYGSQSSESSIIGYVLSGKIPEIVNELVSEIAKVTPVSNLSRELRYMEPQYSSQHMRNLDNQEITIHHLFFDFSH